MAAVEPREAPVGRARIVARQRGERLRGLGVLVAGLEGRVGRTEGERGALAFTRPQTAERDRREPRDDEGDDDCRHEPPIGGRPVHGLAGQRLELVRLAERLAADLDPLGVLGHARESALPYILYLKSSGDIFSRISAHLSREMLERSWSFPS